MVPIIKMKRNLKMAVAAITLLQKRLVAGEEPQ
jgi:hypothetical protein